MNKVDDKKKVESAFNTIGRDLLKNEQQIRTIGLDL